MTMFHCMTRTRVFEGMLDLKNSTSTFNPEKVKFIISLKHLKDINKLILILNRILEKIYTQIIRISS